MGKLVKYIASVLCALVVVCLFSSVAFADSLLDPTYDTALKNFNYVWNDAYENGVVCPKCGHIISKLMMGTCANCGFNALVDDGTVNNYRPGFEAGGGSAGSGVGRKDILGYSGDGVPSVSYEGNGIFKLEPYYWIESTRTTTTVSSSGRNNGFYSEVCPNWENSWGILNTDDVILKNGIFYADGQYATWSFGVTYSMDAPVTGTYTIYKSPTTKYSYLPYSYNGTATRTSGNLGRNAIGYFSTSNYQSAQNKGSKLFWQYGRYIANSGNSTTISLLQIEASDLYIKVQSNATDLDNKSTITINNNTWNGNIYVDNSNNLTYIYPQYTTINENNETVTNISTNPIIYNNETKQYYTYVNNNYYYLGYNDKPSATPAPTWTPGGGATRGGGVGRHPSDTDAADWTLHYYILNNRRYDAYYALKKTEVDTETKLPWVDNKKYISTTQIPIANGQYTVSVPDGVYWRVWSWDEASQTLTGVNSSNWHSTITNFLFNATGEYIFEFCKADGSDFNTAKDVTLKLQNDKITEYEPGGTLDTEPVTPDTQNYIIPKMNSNTFTDSHGTWVASGSSKYSDSSDYFRAFDRTSGLWQTNVTPSNIQIEIPDPENYYIDGYIMKVSQFAYRYAKEWTLQGSDDGETWNDLDTQTGQDLSDLTEHKYSLALHKSYKYYRLNMSNYASSFVSLSHFNLLGYDAKDVVIPTPSPSPTPDPGTNPSPTPNPGGGTVPTPGGDSGGNSGGGSSWNPFKWLTDLLKDIVETILKGLWKLLTSIFGFILWLLSLLFKLFPWMPNSGILALCAGVVVVTVIRIIKFITGR